MRPEARRRLASAPRFQSLGSKGLVATARPRAIVLRARDLPSRVPVMHLRPLALMMCVAVLHGCTADTAEQRATPAEADAPLRDDFGGTLPVLAQPPERIVSLNPATTDLLFALGAGPRVVGRSRWDLYPAAVRDVPSLGDALRPSVEAVLGARPDFVVLYASEDNRPAYERLRAANVPTISLRTDRIADFDGAARLLGRLTGDSAAGAVVADSVQRTLARVRRATRELERPSVFWRIWEAPLITIGRGSFLSELVDVAGARNVYEDIAAPSAQITFEDVVRRDPDFVLVGPEGSASLSQDPAWRALRAVREGRIRVVDTLLVGRPSVRLGEAAMHLAQLLHPGITIP